MLDLFQMLLITSSFLCIKSAYCAQHSTETALAHLFNDMVLAINNGEVRALVLLDRVCYHRPWFCARCSSSMLQCSSCRPGRVCLVLHRLDLSRCFRWCTLLICPWAQSRCPAGIRAWTEILHHLCWRCHRYLAAVSCLISYLRRWHTVHQACQTIASQWGGIWTWELRVVGEWWMIKTPSVEYHENRSYVLQLCNKPQ